MTTKSLDGQKKESFSMTFVINDLKKCRESQTSNTSQVETHFGVDWYMKTVFDNQGRCHINFYNDTEKLAEKRSRISVQATLFFVKPSKFTIVSGKPMQLTSCQNGYIVGQYIDCGHIIGTNVVDEGTIRCDVNLYFDQPPFKLDFATPSEEILSDVVLLVEDREFKVSKAILANISTFFKTMFFDQYKESKKPLIPLELVDADDFHELLEVIYHETDVTQLLELVTYFNMANIRDKCEQALLNAPDTSVPLNEKLFLADKYVLPQLLEKCMTSFTYISQLKAATPRDVKKLSPSTIARLLQRVIDLP